MSQPSDPTAAAAVVAAPPAPSAFNPALDAFLSMHRKFSTESTTSSVATSNAGDIVDTPAPALAPSLPKPAAVGTAQPQPPMRGEEGVQEEQEARGEPATAMALRDKQAILDILSGKVKTANHVGVGPFMRLAPEWVGADGVRRSSV